jgi:type IV pilus assembly protein PilW
MVTDAATPTGRAKCMLQEVAGAGSYTPGSGVTALPLAGTFAAGSVTSGAGSLALTSFTIDATVTPMGNLLATDGALAKAVDNLPSFQLLGVGNNASLYAYDLLSGAAAATPIADSVIELHALYGLDTTVPADGVVDTWMDPGTSPFTAAELMAGTETAAANLAQIKAVRIGLILRSPLLEKFDSKNPQVTGPTLGLFGTLPCPPATPGCTGMSGFTITRSLNAAERNYRYRTVELTIPLRNLMLN